MSDFDINKIATDLNGKADMDLTNTIGALSASSKNYFSGLGMPSGKYIDLTLGASGTEYTAPANGWVQLIKKTTGSSQYIQLKGNITMTIQGNTSDQWLHCDIPITKNSTFKAEYTASGDLVEFRFIYAQGESEE